MKNILYFNQWLGTSWPFQDQVVLLNDHFQCQREQMMFVDIKWMERSLVHYRGWELLFEMAVWKLKVRLGWKLIQILCFRKIICKIILNFSWIQVHQSTGPNLIIKVRVRLKRAWTWTKLDRGQSICMDWCTYLTDFLSLRLWLLSFWNKNISLWYLWNRWQIFATYNSLQMQDNFLKYIIVPIGIVICQLHHPLLLLCLLIPQSSWKYLMSTQVSILLSIFVGWFTSKTLTHCLSGYFLALHSMSSPRHLALK